MRSKLGNGQRVYFMSWEQVPVYNSSGEKKGEAGAGNQLSLENGQHLSLLTVTFSCAG